MGHSNHNEFSCFSNRKLFYGLTGKFLVFLATTLKILKSGKTDI